MRLDTEVHFKIEAPWGMSVHGTGVIQAEPEIARVRLAVDLLRPAADLAFTDAEKAVSRLRAALDEHGVPDAAVSGSRLKLSSEFSGYGVDRTFLGYRCIAQYTVQTTALDTIQDLILAAVAAGAERIDEVAFDVRDKPAIRDAARREAVQAARRKAEIYAAAAGAALGAVVHIQDLNPETEVTRGHGGGGGASSSDLVPGMVEVSAAVLVGYTLDGDFAG